jgi:hypothetical protein
MGAGREERIDLGSGDNGREGGGGGDGGEVNVEEVIDRLWNRGDRRKWMAEMTSVHRAFERGGEWGVVWAACLDKYLDFEAACGYSDTGGQITTEDRPAAVAWWLGRGRKWDKTVDVGVLGDVHAAETFVAMWWKWWVKVQPKDRADWGPMVKLHGKTGILQVMATLLWWREAVSENPLQEMEWETAVEDVSGVLTELLRPGVVPKK